MRVWHPSVALFVCIAMGVATAQQSALCIDMTGSCINAEHATCGGELRQGYDCPEKSLCCLPYGALCSHLDGECTSVSACRDGKLVDHDILCSADSSSVCCLDRTARAVAIDPRADAGVDSDRGASSNGPSGWRKEGAMLAIHVVNGSATLQTLSTETILNSVFIPIVYAFTIGVALGSVTVWKARKSVSKPKKTLS